MNIAPEETTVDTVSRHFEPEPQATASPAPARFRIQRVSSENELCVLREAWTELMASARPASPFQTWEWVTGWWRHFHAGRELWVLLAWDAAGSLVALLPLMMLRDGWGPFHVRRLTFLGRGIVYPVHLDVVARPEDKVLASNAFVGFLEAHRRDWDVLDLADLHEDSPLRTCLAALGSRYRELAPAIARASSLPATWEAYEHEKLSSTRRKHLGQYRRKLEREHEGVSFYQVADTAGLRWALEAMSELNRARWHGRQVASAFDDRAFVAFHQELAAIALGEGWLRFYVLRVGDEMAGGVYGLLYDHVFYCYQTAFNASWRKYGPGQLMLGYAIQQAIRDGAIEWNMMRGDQEYKLSWTDRERPDPHIVVSSTWVGRAWAWGDRALDCARTYGRQHLSQDLRERLTQLLTRKGMGHESDGAGHLSN